QALDDLNTSRKELADANKAFTDAKAKNLPLQMEMAEQRINVARQNANTAVQRLSQNPNATGAGGTGSTLVDEIGTGRMPPGRMSYLLARNPQLLTAIAASYPDFDGSKIESYAKTYNDFTSGKTSVMLTSGGTAL